MKKIIIATVIAGLVALYLVRKASEKYDQMENNVYSTKESRVAERHGIVAPNVGQASPPRINIPPSSPSTPPSPSPGPSSPSPASSSGSGVVSAGQANQTNLVICLREIAAFNPSRPSIQIGNFLKDTPLAIGPKDALSGMYYVTYQPKNGKPVRALCRAEDLGK